MAPSPAREAHIVALANGIGAGLDAEQVPRNRGCPPKRPAFMHPNVVR
jgi:hypothetical protein